MKFKELREFMNELVSQKPEIDDLDICVSIPMQDKKDGPSAFFSPEFAVVSHIDDNMIKFLLVINTKSEVISFLENCETVN